MFERGKPECVQGEMASRKKTIRIRAGTYPLPCFFLSFLIFRFIRSRFNMLRMLAKRIR